MVIWKDVPVKIRTKIGHIKKIGGRFYRSFVNDFGDVPVARWNSITNKIEEVVNLRGKAYAARSRSCYRKVKK